MKMKVCAMAMKIILSSSSNNYYVVQDSEMYVLHIIGSVTNVLVKYNRIHQTIICTSTGGPATDVTWYKDKTQTIIPNEGGAYSYSQIITNITNATYENRLRIVDKSSEAAGNYTCQVINSRGSVNSSLYIQGNHRAS